MNLDTDRAGFLVTFSANDLEAREGIRAIAGQLRQQGISEERTGDVEIALAEAINNVVEHAYAGVEAGQIHVSCHLRAGRLEIRIHDRGRPMPGGDLPSGEPAEPADLPEGGFGWFLIRQLATEIKYERRGEKNLLWLRFDLPEKPDA